MIMHIAVKADADIFGGLCRATCPAYRISSYPYHSAEAVFTARSAG